MTYTFTATIGASPVIYTAQFTDRNIAVTAMRSFHNADITLVGVTVSSPRGQQIATEFCKRKSRWEPSPRG